MIFGWKRWPFGVVEFYYLFLLSFLQTVKPVRLEMMEWTCRVWGSWKSGLSLSPGALGLLLGLPNALHLSEVCSVSFFTCYHVTQENGSMMCLCLYCRKMDLVMWGHWGNRPQIPRGRKAGGKYSGRKALWTSRWLKVLVGLWPFSIWCIISYVLMADLVAIKVYLFF